MASRNEMAPEAVPPRQCSQAGRLLLARLAAAVAAAVATRQAAALDLAHLPAPVPAQAQTAHPPAVAAAEFSHCYSRSVPCNLQAVCMWIGHMCTLLCNTSIGSQLASAYASMQ